MKGPDPSQCATGYAEGPPLEESNSIFDSFSEWIAIGTYTEPKPAR